MDSFIKIEIPVHNEEQSDMLVAALSTVGFSGFEETETALLAYIDERDFDEVPVVALVHSFGLVYLRSSVENKNWNEEWERNFEPVQVNDFCRVRAAFHPTDTHARYEVIITPKMSFGTGHHATTFMMMAALEKMNLEGKTVLDFGTGTGILAILASKCGAAEVLAIDNDPLSIENLIENIEINNCQSIEIEQNDTIRNTRVFDIILANINRNIILGHFDRFWQHLAPGGVLLLSGLLLADQDDILFSAHKNGFVLISRAEREGWLCLEFKKKDNSPT